RPRGSRCSVGPLADEVAGRLVVADHQRPVREARAEGGVGRAVLDAAPDGYRAAPYELRIVPADVRAEASRALARAAARRAVVRAALALLGARIARVVVAHGLGCPAVDRLSRCVGGTARVGAGAGVDVLAQPEAAEVRVVGEVAAVCPALRR